MADWREEGVQVEEDIGYSAEYIAEAAVAHRNCRLSP